MAGATEGEAFASEASDDIVVLTCTDVWGNAGGDWVGAIAGQLGEGGNTCQDPWFCDPENLDFTLAVGSPCAPDGIPGCGLIGAWPVACDWPTAAPDGASGAGRPRLINAPNPFNPATTITFELPRPGHVHLTVHALDGRLVARLADGFFPAGEHVIAWHGRDDAGRAFPSGTYLSRLVTEEGSTTARMALIR